MPAFRIAAYVMYSISHDITFCFVFPFFCVIVTVTLVFVSPYKQPYQKYNRVDFVMILSLGIAIDAYLFNFTNAYLEHPYSYIGRIVFFIFSLSPLVYFTVRLCLSMKRVLVQKFSNWHRVHCNGQQDDYEDLNSINSM